MEKVIPWIIGGGNLHLTFTGVGNGKIQVSSDTENLTGEERSQTITIKTTDNKVVKELIVRQSSRKAYVNAEVLVLTNALNASVTGETLSIVDKEVKVEEETLII